MTYVTSFHEVGLSFHTTFLPEIVFDTETSVSVATFVLFSFFTQFPSFLLS